MNVVSEWFIQLHWQQVEWLWLLPLIAVVMIWRHRSPNDQDDFNAVQRMEQQSVYHSLLRPMQQTKVVDPSPLHGLSKPSLVHLPSKTLSLFRFLILSLLLISLSNPKVELPPEPQPQQKTVRDILFVIESSASFLLKDYQQDGEQISRMQAVKSVLHSFIEGLPGNRFAMTVYAENAFNLMPLSNDQQGASLYLQRLRPYLAGRTDQAMAEALGLALKQTQHQSQLILETAKASESNNKQVLILISDGDNLPSRFPIWSAVNYAKFLTVPIYTIGVGSDSAQADKREFRGLLYQTLKDDQLKLIAEETQGRYFKVGNKKELDQVLREIDQLEGVPLKEETIKQKWQSLYFYPLSFAFFLMLIYLVLISRSQTTRGAL